MTVGGGPAEGTLTCAVDGVDTRLRCRDCQAPICPDCFVRTPVGLRCRTCGADTMPLVLTGGGRRRGPLVFALAVVAALAVAGTAWALTRGNPSASDDPAAGEQAAARRVDPLTIGSGEFANGASWTLVARRDGMICYTMAPSTASARPEQCRRPPGNRAFSFISRLTVTGPGGTVYVTVGLVSDQVERVRVVPEGTLGADEVATVGADAGLGGRFFVAETSVNGALSITAVSANGNPLGRANVSAIRQAPPR